MLIIMIIIVKLASEIFSSNPMGWGRSNFFTIVYDDPRFIRKLTED